MATGDGGSVVALWRYPVKSMMGEELNAAVVTERGLLGDRAYALLDNEFWARWRARRTRASGPGSSISGRPSPRRRTPRTRSPLYLANTIWATDEAVSRLKETAEVA